MSMASALPLQAAKAVSILLSPSSLPSLVYSKWALLSAMQLLVLAATWSTAVFTARMRRAVRGLPLPKSAIFIASRTLSGILSGPPNMSAMACLKRSRTSLFTSRDAWRRPTLPTKSNEVFATIVRPASGLEPAASFFSPLICAMVEPPFACVAKSVKALNVSLYPLIPSGMDVSC